MNNNDNKKVLLIFLLMLGLTVIIFGISYAFFRYSKEGTKQVTISLGSVKLHYEESSLKKINLTNALPMNDERGKAQTDYFEFTITSETTSYEIPYYVAARINTIEANRIPTNYVSLYLTEVSSNSESQVLLTTYDNLTDVSKNNHIEQQLMLNTVAANTANYEKTYRLRMWINEDADYSPVEVNGEQTYPMQDKEFAITINVYTEAEEVQNCNLAFKMAEPLQVAGTLSAWDEVSIGTEKFFVISSDSDTTVLLSKYNVYPLEFATPPGSVGGLQYNPNLYQLNEPSNFAGVGYDYGLVPFADTAYWESGSYEENIYNENYNSAPDYNLYTCINSFYVNTNYNGSYEDAISDLYSNYDNLRESICIALDDHLSGVNYYYDDDDDEFTPFKSQTGYSIAYYVNDYKNTIEGMGATITKARLLREDEDENYTSMDSDKVGSIPYFWIDEVYDENIDHTDYYLNTRLAIRPVLEVPTCSIDLSSAVSNTQPEVGDKYCYESECFRVVKNEDDNTILLAEFSLDFVYSDYFEASGLQVSPYKGYSHATFRVDTGDVVSTSSLNNAQWQTLADNLELNDIFGSYNIDDAEGDYNPNTATPYPFEGDEIVTSYYDNSYLEKIKAFPYNVPQSASIRLLKKEEADLIYTNSLFNTNKKFGSSFWLGSKSNTGYNFWVWNYDANTDTATLTTDNETGLHELRPVLVIPTADLSITKKVND